jgi:site-specific DNA-cytosine methylase
MKYAYYNDIDPFACEWLRELIKAGLIMDGEVDERSIADVQADDIRGFVRHHFFSGIAGWERALQLAKWPEDRPVCTASLPCQPFSVAGKQLGKKDERHLWPEFERLVRECRFPTIFGEQVPGAIKLGWLDEVFDSLEKLKYETHANIIPAAAVGAYHIRSRLFFVATQQNLQGLCCTKTVERLRQGTQMSLWPQKYLSGLSQCATERSTGQEISTGDKEAQKLEEGYRILKRETAQACDIVLDSGGKKESKKKEDSVRPRPAYGRTYRKGEADAVRTVWNPSSDGEWNQRLQFDKPGSSGREQGVHHRQRQNCMLGDKCRCWNMGAKEGSGDIQSYQRGCEINDRTNNEKLDATTSSRSSRVQNEMDNSNNTKREGDSQNNRIDTAHLRQRLWWVAKSTSNRPQRFQEPGERWNKFDEPIRVRNDGRMADSISQGLEGYSGNGNNRCEPGRLNQEPDGSASEGSEHSRVADARGNGRKGYLHHYSAECGENTRPNCGDGRDACGMGNPKSNHQQRDRESGEGERQDGEDRGSGLFSSGISDTEGAGQLRAPEHEDNGQDSSGRGRQDASNIDEGGFWDNSIWWPCSDGKARRIPATESGFLLLPDGFWYRMADVYSEYVTQTIKEVKDYATTVGVNPEKAMLMVQETIRKEAVQSEKNKKRETWEAGRQDSFYKTEVLFTFMRDVISTLNGTADYSCGKEKVSKNDRRMLRDLRNHIEAKCASYRWKSEEYSGSKPADTLLALSQFLAQCGQEIWAYKCRTDAAAFPLAGKVQGRVGLLKGAGNSIVPQVAAVFIRATIGD